MRDHVPGILTELFGGLANRIYRIGLGLFGVLALFAGTLGALVGWSWATELGSGIIPAGRTVIGAFFFVLFLAILFVWTRWLVRTLAGEMQRDIARDISDAIASSEGEQDASPPV